MKKIRRQDFAIFLIQLLVWVLVIAAPATISYVISPKGGAHMIFLFQSLGMLGPLFIIYMISYYLLIPFALYRGNKWLFILCSAVLLILLNVGFFIADVSSLPAFAQIGFYSRIATSFSTGILVIIAALGIRSFVRSHELQIELEEKQRKTAEAELVWLKNQLNPHFLFNSLNNISSLTQIDPDQAQDAIGQLSDLLRYALYESNKPEVSLAGEVEFMKNYVSLMRLRCSDKTRVEESYNIGQQSHQIAPLLFISFIENAFKHGTSNNHDSHVWIALNEDKDSVTFECRNSNLPKGESDHSGSGIGLENTRRRLELCYPDSYEWEQGINDGDFCIKIVINFKK